MANFCKVCGSELPDGVKFCTECGTPIDAVSAPEKAQAAPETAQAAPSAPVTPAATAENQPTVDSIVEEVRREAAADQLRWTPEEEDAGASPEAHAAPAPQPTPVTPIPAAPVIAAPAEPAAPLRQPGQPPVVRPPVYNTPVHDVPPQPPEELPPEDPEKPPLKSRWAIMSSWGAVGALALMGIPGLGLIIAVIWACGGCRKYAKRNLARGLLLLFVLCLAVTVVAALVYYFIALRGNLPELLDKFTRIFEIIFDGYTITWG